MTDPFCDPTEFSYRPGSLFLGKTDSGQEVGISTEIHAIAIGGSGAGKGVGLLIPNARRWPHNLFVIDPKGENAVLSWKAREAKGQRVGVLGRRDVPAIRAPLPPWNSPRAILAGWTGSRGQIRPRPSCRMRSSVTMGSTMVTFPVPQNIRRGRFDRQRLFPSDGRRHTHPKPHRAAFHGLLPSRADIALQCVARCPTCLAGRLGERSAVDVLPQEVGGHR